MSVNIVTDRSKNIVWNARKGDDQTLTINVEDSNEDAYDLSGETFTVLLMRFGNGATVLSLTQGSGLTNGGAAGTLQITFSAAQLAIEADTYMIIVKSAGTLGAMTWLNGTFILNGELWDGETTIEETITISTAAVELTLQIVAGGGGSSFEFEDYTGFEAAGGTFPTATEGKFYRLVFNTPGTPVFVGGVYYEHNSIIVYRGSGNWQSWPSNFGASS